MAKLEHGPLINKHMVHVRLLSGQDFELIAQTALSQAFISALSKDINCQQDFYSLDFRPSSYSFIF